MKPLKRSPLYGSVVALPLTAFALMITLVLGPYLEPNIFLFFIAAVWLSTWYFGRTAGLIATAASAVEVYYFFLRPEPGVILSFSAVFRLLAFVAMALLIAWITASWRESRRLMAATLSSIADAVLATDREGSVTFLN